MKSLKRPQKTKVTGEIAPDEAVIGAGDVANGQTLFNANACAGCHSTTTDDRIVGPGLLTIVQRSGRRVSGLTAEQYIRQSIIDPSAYVVDGFPDNTMPQHFGSVLSEQDIADLIAFLKSLG